MTDGESIFTEDAMTRPLFEGLTSEHAREDGWSGPHGFAFGGMMQANNASLAEEYFLAANELVSAVKDQRVEDYRVANVALFLYRHSVELLLKAALTEPMRTHDLGELATKFVTMVKSQYGEEVPTWIVRRLKELAEMDERSTAFRYGEYGTPIDESGAPIGFEVYVSLPHLQAAMLALNSALVQVVDEVRIARGR
jgi:HEPN domain-containing protein